MRDQRQVAVMPTTLEERQEDHSSRTALVQLARDPI
jgi:hypothetical protein